MSDLLQEGISLHQQGKLGEAIAIYQRVLKINPASHDALHYLGVCYKQTGRVQEGIELIRASLEKKSDAPLPYNNLGNALQTLGRFDEALACYDKALSLKPDYAVAHNNRGNVLSQIGQWEEALGSYRRASALEPSYLEPIYNEGIVLHRLGRCEQALICYDRMIALAPRSADPYFSRAAVLNDLQRHAEALIDSDKAILLEPNAPEPRNSRGIALNGLKRHEEALAAFDQAILLRAQYAEAWSNRGNTLSELHRHLEALSSFDRAIALEPDYAPAWINRGNTLSELRRNDEALGCFDRALALGPERAEAWLGRANALADLIRHAEALESCDRALRIDSNYAAAWRMRASTLTALQRYDQALASYDKARGLKPRLPYLMGDWLHAKMHVCDWEDFEAACESLRAGILAGERVSNPFPVLAVPSSLALQRRCAEIYVRDRFPPAGGHPWDGPRYSHARVRIGYFSADFHNHATAYLIAELIERHDRSRFEVIGFSYGAPSDDGMRRRLAAAFDRFIDVSGMSDQDTVTLARSIEVDIAVDLKGFTQAGRTGVFAMRAAPIQVSYLGYPGTTGAGYMDYLIADRTVLPEDHVSHYVERIVYLPNSYQVNDSSKSISSRVPDRDKAGLTEGSFVFCCFNNSYKITPPVFDIWMRLLGAVDGSVLWLLRGNDGAVDRLRTEAQKRGVSPDRLVFAERVDLPEHLARHRLADLFLDTLFCNAHTTASDALWAGLPIVTCLGETFAGRVAASLLNAVGLPELVAHSIAEYEAIALDLVAKPLRLAGLKRSLLENRASRPLYDTVRFTRDIEAAYARMWDIFQADLKPVSFGVDDASTRRF